MTDCILYTRQDDSVVILHPAAHSGLKGEKPEETLARIIHEVVPSDAIKVLVVDSRNLPTDYRFHGAWQLQGANIGTDMPKARDIHRDRIRAARAPLMAQLDVDYQRADEVGDASKKQEIASRKQLLRDATAHPDIEAAQTPDELAGVWPLQTTPPASLTQEPVLLQRKPDPEWSMSDLLTRAANEASIGQAEPESSVIPAITVHSNPDTAEPFEPLRAPEVVLVPPLPPEPVDDTARRRAAKAAIRRAVASMAQNSHDLQMRYELALQAHNGNVEALDIMEEEATLKGLSGSGLAEQIIIERRVRERRMMQVYAAQERAFKALETTSGDAIGIVENHAINEIRGTGTTDG
jgi:hypothetical protein